MKLSLLATLIVNLSCLGQAQTEQIPAVETPVEVPSAPESQPENAPPPIPKARIVKEAAPAAPAEEIAAKLPQQPEHVVVKEPSTKPKPIEVGPPGQTAPEPEKGDELTALKVQIFLDENNFGPGKIDGEIGEFTRKAAEIFNQVHGFEAGNWYYLLRAAQKAVPNTYAAYQLDKNDFRFVVPDLPEQPDQQASYKYLGYRSIREFVAERYHTSEEFLIRANPGVKWGQVKPGDMIRVPNVRTPFCIEEVAYSKKYEPDQVLSSRRVVIDTKARVAIFYDENGKLHCSFPITPGKAKFLHFGEWEITNMVTTPEFRWDKSMLEQGERSEKYFQLPPGPNSPVGLLWAGTNKKGIGLHGTSSPHTIGRSQSAGCVRFANWDAIRLPGIIRPGAKVVIK